MAAKTGLTAADLITMPPPENGKHYELTRDGELIVVGTANGRHEEVKRAIAKFLFRFPDIDRLGAVYVESMFTLTDGAARVPDVAFVSDERRQKVKAIDSDGPLSFVPDLAIEVISPSDSLMQVEDKLWDYLEGGVTEVWLVLWNRRMVRSRTKSAIRDFLSGDVVETPILPGLRLPVADIFADIP